MTSPGAVGDQPDGVWVLYKALVVWALGFAPGPWRAPGSRSSPPGRRLLRGSARSCRGRPCCEGRAASSSSSPAVTMNSSAFGLTSARAVRSAKFPRYDLVLLVEHDLGGLAFVVRGGRLDRVGVERQLHAVDAVAVGRGLAEDRAATDRLHRGARQRRCRWRRSRAPRRSRSAAAGRAPPGRW